jgi:hypothetical protein
LTIKTNVLNGVAVDATDVAAENASKYTNGVFSISSGALNVLAHSPANLTVDVSAGSAEINGYYIKSDAVVNVSIGANSSGFNRIDNIVVNVDTTNKVTTIIAVQGVPSSSPVPPAVASNQLLLSTVLVGNNVSVLNQNVITDGRVSVDILDSQLASKANKTQEAWIAPTLLNGWVNFGGTFQNSGYFKDNFGIVHLKGTVKSGTYGATVFTLPVGYRPLLNVNFATVSNGSAAMASVDSSGNVTFNAGSNAWDSIDGMSFRAEQ